MVSTSKFSPTPSLRAGWHRTFPRCRLLRLARDLIPRVPGHLSRRPASHRGRQSRGEPRVPLPGAPRRRRDRRRGAPRRALARTVSILAPRGLTNPRQFGQSWPGLIYLPTITFLTPDEQLHAGITGNTQEEFNEIVPFHEVAHQWLGDTVGWQSYRDQWIDEALANYVALLALDSRNPDKHLLRHSLDLYRDDLAHPAAAGGPIADLGPVTLGNRLDSASDPDAYQKIAYGKGTWIFHMLRMMLREPGARDPDARFTAFLHALVKDYRHRPLSTDDLEREVENVMTASMALEEKHSMAWFFDQWVRGSGMPRYSVQFVVQPKGKRVLTEWNPHAGRGARKISLPLCRSTHRARRDIKHSSETCVTSGRETRFHFAIASSPKRLLIDPQQTLLCLHD